MYSERIKIIASEISENDRVVDVGCDHGYLSLYLKQNKLCAEIFASDIKESALNMAKTNFKKYNVKIKTILSDGFENIKEDYNTAVIAGMGTSTILKIISHPKTPDKLVLASNNDYYKLRLNLNKRGYKIVDEKAVWEKNHYYIILLCIKGKQKLKLKELLFGISNDDDYYKYLWKKNKELIKKVPIRKKIKLFYEMFLLKGLIEKK